MRERSVLLCILTLISSVLAPGQSGTPVDVMPLHVGNTWTYDYRFTSIDNYAATEDDSGVVECRITEMNPAADSTRWVVIEQRNFRESLTNRAGIRPKDTTFTVVDSATYEIVERLEGLHHMYRTQTENYISISAFPWGLDFTDTASVNRYAEVDSAGIAEFETHSSAPFYGFAYTFRFERGLGEQQVQTHSVNVVGLAASSRHTLIRSVIASVNDERPARLPATPVLFQNYPNPFNPSTTIGYALPRRVHVSLTVFNVLGEEVARLVNTYQAAGSHDVKFNGNGLPSGVYFCRLQAGDFVGSKRLTLIR
jgi:hypothetical protein